MSRWEQRAQHLAIAGLSRQFRPFGLGNTRTRVAGLARGRAAAYTSQPMSETACFNHRRPTLGRDRKRVASFDKRSALAPVL